MVIFKAKLQVAKSDMEDCIMCLSAVVNGPSSVWRGLARDLREREREEKKEAFSQLQTNALISKDIRSDKQIANEMTILCLSHSGS